jgi:hypothetical protein
MVTSEQLKSLNEDELAYLFIALGAEWENIKMPYEFDIKFVGFFKKEAVTFLINKYKSNLKEEYKDLPESILSKLE